MQCHPQTEQKPAHHPLQSEETTPLSHHLPLSGRPLNRQITWPSRRRQRRYWLQTRLKNPAKNSKVHRSWAMAVKKCLKIMQPWQEKLKMRLSTARNQRNALLPRLLRRPMRHRPHRQLGNRTYSRRKAWALVQVLWQQVSVAAWLWLVRKIQKTGWLRQDTMAVRQLHTSPFVCRRIQVRRCKVNPEITEWVTARD